MSTTEEALATAQRSLDDLVRHRRERVEKLIAKWMERAESLDVIAQEDNSWLPDEADVCETVAIAKTLRECAEELEKAK